MTGQAEPNPPQNLFNSTPPLLTNCFSPDRCLKSLQLQRTPATCEDARGVKKGDGLQNLSRCVRRFKPGGGIDRSTDQVKILKVHLVRNVPPNC